MKATSLRLWLPACLMCWGLLGACASLPNVNELGARLDAADAPSVHGKNGELSAARTKALFTKRYTKNTLDLQQQAALEEAATGVPPVSYTHLTLPTKA